MSEEFRPPERLVLNVTGSSNQGAFSACSTVPLTITDQYASGVCGCGWSTSATGGGAGETVTRRMREHVCDRPRQAAEKKDEGA